MKTIKISGKELPFDDRSGFRIENVEVFTETAVVDGVAHLGFGQFVADAGGENVYVRDGTHLRFPALMLPRLAEQIALLINMAEKQGTQIRQSAEAVLKGVTKN